MMLSAAAYDRRKAFSAETSSDTYDFPYATLQVPPSPEDLIAAVHVDDELGREALTYTLDSGREGTVHLNQVLDHNREPGYVADLLLYKLTVEAEKRLEAERQRHPPPRSPPRGLAVPGLPPPRHNQL
jgi:hypothetical protein